MFFSWKILKYVRGLAGGAFSIRQKDGFTEKTKKKETMRLQDPVVL